jgi:hypothetical protein
MLLAGRCRTLDPKGRQVVNKTTGDVRSPWFFSVPSITIFTAVQVNERNVATRRLWVGIIQDYGN